MKKAVLLNKRILNLSDFVNESLLKPDGKLDKAAEVIAKYVNKKTGKDFKKYPFKTNVKVGGYNLECIRFYSDKTTESFWVTSAVAGTVGIVGSLIYFADAANSRSDFSVSSDKFPIVKLVGEFVNLMDKKYIGAISESMLTERRQARPFTGKELKIIAKRLDAKVAVSKIAAEFNVPYSAIIKIKKGETVEVEANPIEETNNQTLQDKVKYLEETMEDIYQISRRVAAGAFNSLFISGRAGTGKTYNVERAMKDEGLVDEEDYVLVSGAASVIMMYKKFYQYRTKTLIFDDCDAVFRDENGRNLLKAALDTKPARKVSYLKKTSAVFDPKDFDNDPEGEFNALEAGLVPNSFMFEGRVIFISNLPKDKADPDGAIRSRSILIDVTPDDATLMERMKKLLPYLEPKSLPLEEKEEIYEFMKSAKDVSMRTFVKAAAFKVAKCENWKRMATRYL